MIEAVSGLWALACLALRSGFRLRGPYWHWRLHTAFGRGYPASRAALLRSIVDYARWMHRMRALR